MKIYLLINWDNYEYARFSHIGTWSKETESCERCGYSDQHLIEPLQIEWEPDTDIIGDLSWCGYSIVVLENVKKLLLEKYFECEFGKVEVKKSTTPKKHKKIVNFPYIGPDLFWLKPTEYINLDIQKSILEIDEDCPVCKKLRYRFKMDGLVFPEVEVKGKKMFRVKQFGLSAATYITEIGLKELLEKDFKNLWYKEVGYTT